MAQKWTLDSSSNNIGRLTYAAKAAVHLSDGTLVFVHGANSATLTLAYSADHTTTTDIATLTGFTETSAAGGSSMPNAVAVARDASDNIYVIGSGASAAYTYVQAFTKGAGRTWTAQSLVAGNVANGTAIRGHAAVWCATGGGTSNAGHLLVLAELGTAVRYGVIDAGACLAGTAPTTAAGGFTSSGTAITGAVVDLANDGFGSATVLGVGATSATALAVASFTISSAGALAQGGPLSVATGSVSGSSGKVRLIRYGSNAWALVTPSTTAGHYNVSRFSTTAQLTAPTDSGTPTNMPVVGNTSGWDAFLDPGTASTVQVIAQSSTTANVYRVPVTVGSGVSWGTTATLDDTLSPWSAQGSAQLRAVTHPVGQTVDWQVHAQTASAPTYALLGDYTAFNQAPNAPTLNGPANNTTLDRTAIQRFSWTFSDPNAGDTQSAFDLQYRIGTAAWTTVSGTTPNQYVDFASGTFSAATYEWQVRTYDAQGAVGPWSASSFFTAATAPSTPTITYPVSGGTVNQNDSVTWSTPSQTDYEVRRVADNAGAADTGTIYYDTGDVLDSVSRTAALTFPVNNRFEHIQVRVKAAGLWSSWADVRVNASYTPPAQPTITLTPNNSAGTLAVGITNPTPTGGQPAVAYNDVYVNDGAGEKRLATQLATNAAWTYWTPVSGREYAGNVRVVAVASNGTSTSS